MNNEEAYADDWREPINATYPHADEREFGDGEADETELITQALRKAADCLRNGATHTFTGPELDVVRYLMPAHEVHQSGSVRWVLENYGIRV